MDKKIRVLVSGCCGKMGHIVVEEIRSRDNIEVVAGLGTSCSKVGGIDVYDAESFNIDHDVIIDFSSPNALSSLFEISRKFKSKLVLCTTGYSESQLNQIKKFSKEYPVFLSSNTSLGINTLVSVSKFVKEKLGKSFDIEITEKHHNKKIDAPSGTALMISNALSSEETEIVFDRSKKKQKRSQNEIGIHSIRGGGITGEHEVLFIGENEVLSLKHVAYSRRIFAQGAIKASCFIIKKKNGLYDMNDLIN